MHTTTVRVEGWTFWAMLDNLGGFWLMKKYEPQMEKRNKYVCNHSFFVVSMRINAIIIDN